MSCQHLTEFKERTINVDRYKLVCSRFIYPRTPAERKLKSQLLTCAICNEPSARLMTCIGCVFIYCGQVDHFAEHARTTGHNFSVDLSFGQFHCFECKDFVYDAELEVGRQDAENVMRKVLGLTQIKRWIPTWTDIEALQANNKRLKLDPGSFVGLRGLINLGNTCFMNCILQALTHTPLLRDYFMCDRHHCRTLGESDECLMCEMKEVFQEFYNGTRTPYIPYKLLHLVWTHALHLAGYEQQDAHEFLIAALGLLHKHCKAPSVVERTGEQSRCSCIIDQIFTGRLQSDVQCQSCFNVSTTVDPCWDISLDISSNSMKSPSNYDLPDQPNILDCLERFTRPENLGSGAKIACSRCKSHEESTKQMTLKKLPIVCSFHLKRFEHSTRHRKISKFVSFPRYLDLTPFTSRERNTRRESMTRYVQAGGSSPSKVTNGCSAEPTSVSTGEKLNRLKNKYSLYAVVNHSGTMETGHYTCFIRQQAEQWFKCDDHVITKATLHDVLNSEAYLLFYHKQFLDYQNQ